GAAGCCARRRRPRAALFPYATLSRSQRHQGEGALVQARMRHPQAGLVDDVRAVQQQIQVQGPWAPAVAAVSSAHAAEAALDFSSDRKSTRLNSSHVKISYAVFCLKKK